MDDLALLLAGYGTDPRRLHPLADGLRAAGVHAEVHAYAPVGTLDGLASDLAGRIDRHGRRVHLVGHSLGGLVAAAAALVRSDRVATVTTVNAPWRGTWVSYTGADRIATALRWRSADLARLRAGLVAHHAVPEGPRWLLVSALGDLAVPASSALRVGIRSPRLHRRTVPVNGHSISLLSPRMVDTVTRHITAHHDAATA